MGDGRNESSTRRKSTPGDASMRWSIPDLTLGMCRSIHDLAQTSCIKTEHAVEDVCQLLSILAYTFTHPLSHIASFGDSRWIFLTRSYTLSSILMSACQASWTRHVRSEEVATSSRCVARPSLALQVTQSPTLLGLKISHRH